MSPILGIIASSISGSKAVTNSYESIATVTVGTAVSSISFASIPSTYKHLQIRFIGRDSRTGASEDTLLMQLNSDTTASNYYSHRLYGDGASAGADAFSTLAGNLMGTAPDNGKTASTFAGHIIDILDYANTNKYKTSRNLGGYDANGSGFLFLSSGLWKNTNAVTDITLKLFSAANFVQYSQAALYGIKG